MAALTRRRDRYHAQQAVQLYEHLFDHVPDPSHADRRWRETALEQARELLQKAEEDQLTLIQHIKANYGSSERARDAFIARFGEQAADLLEKDELLLKSEPDEEVGESESQDLVQGN